MKTPEFNSVLAPYIQGRIKMKKVSDFSYADGAYMLARFDVFCDSQGLTEAGLPQDIVMQWLQQTPNENRNTLNHRISLIRQLAVHMASDVFGKSARSIT